MQIACIGISKEKKGLVDKLSKEETFSILYFDNYCEFFDRADHDSLAGIIIQERVLQDKGIRLSEMIRLNRNTCKLPILSAQDREIVQMNKVLPHSLDRRCSENTFAASLKDWINDLTTYPSRLKALDKRCLDSLGLLESLLLLHRYQLTGTIFAKDRATNWKGSITFSGGELADASFLHLTGKEAFFEILSWTHARLSSFCDQDPETTTIEDTFWDLLDECFELLKSASLLWSLIPHDKVILRRTDSESALADKAESFFVEKKRTYDLIDGTRSVEQIIEESPLCKPRALSFLASLISMGDASPVCDKNKKGNREYPFFLDPIRVLIVDDSKLIGSALSKIFNKESGFEVLGQAFNGVEALKMIPELDPDVITLDIEMPRMDGLTALKHIMIKFPRPTVMISSLTKEGSIITFEALRYGAVDIIPKPLRLSEKELLKQEEKIRSKVIRASRVCVDALHFVRQKNFLPPVRMISGSTKAEHVFVIGTGLGGYNTLLQLIPTIPAQAPGAYLLMTHFDENYLDPFVNYLDEQSEITVKVAQTNQLIERSTCYVATNAHYVMISNSSGSHFLHLQPAPHSFRDCNSLDMLLFSATDAFSDRVGAIILSGAGVDGVKGSEYASKFGGTILVQKPESCLEPELPTKVLKQVFAARIVRLRDVPQIIEEHSNRGKEVEKSTKNDEALMTQ